jgi:hypothetical protein
LARTVVYDIALFRLGRFAVTRYGFALNESRWPGFGVFWGRAWGFHLRTRGWAFYFGPMFRSHYHVVRLRRGGEWIPSTERKLRRL